MKQMTFNQLCAEVRELKERLGRYEKRLTESTDPRYKIGERVVIYPWSQYECWGDIVEVWAETSGWMYKINNTDIHEYRQAHESQVSRKL